MTCPAVVKVTVPGGPAVVRVTASAAPAVVRVVTPGPPGPISPALPRSITIAGPLASDNYTLFRAVNSTTISSVTGLVSSGAVSYELIYGENRTLPGTLIAADSVSNTTTGSSIAPQNQPVSAGAWVWIKIISASEAVAEFNLSLAFASES